MNKTIRNISPPYAYYISLKFSNSLKNCPERESNPEILTYIVNALPTQLP